MSILLVGYLCVFKLSAQNLKDFDGAEGHLQRMTMSQGDPLSETESTYISHQYKHHKILPEHRHNKRYRIITVVSLHLQVVHPITASIADIFFPAAIVHTPAMPARYHYRYFKEINPPPPKDC